MKAKNDLTWKQVDALLEYDPCTGDVTWKVGRGHIKSGGKAGYVNPKTNHLHVGINYGQYALHRIAWLLHYKKWPKYCIDHINGNRQDNRIINLRDVPLVLNLRNSKRYKTNTSGYTGVCFKNNRWIARISRDHYIGSFRSKRAAISARKKMERKLKYHPTHGRK